MKSVGSQRLLKSALALGVLGIISMPGVVYAASASTSNTQLQVSVGSVITINSPTTVSLSLTPTAAGPVSIGSHTVTVSTNNTTGYKLYLKDSDATLTLASGGNSIAAGSGTVGTPAALTAMNTYGYAVAGAPFAATYTVASNAAYDNTKTFAGITASDAQLKNT